MAKKTAAKKRTARKKTAPARRAAARSAAATRGSGRPKTAKRKTGRKTAAASARRTSTAKKASRKSAGQKASRGGGAARKAAGRKAAKSARTSKSARKTTRKTATRSRGGRGRERELAQTPETGRSVKGPTNPMPTRRSTGTAAGAGSTRRAPELERKRRQLRDIEESTEMPPSSLDMDRMASAARTGRAEMRQARREHTETSPALTGGDVDANWQDAYAVGDEAPGGDNPTPDQDRVDDIGRALGVTYEDNEELKAVDKIAERDRHRWELDPASSEDYRTRDRDLDEE